jgi:hypothetical protein
LKKKYPLSVGVLSAVNLPGRAFPLLVLLVVAGTISDKQGFRQQKARANRCLAENVKRLA